MGDTWITREGPVRDGQGLGWCVLLSDGARFTAWPPSGRDGWSVTLRLGDGDDGPLFCSCAATLPRSVDEACRLAHYTDRTGHVLASLTAHLA